MITRTPNFTTIDLNIVGSSIFGRYPKISTEHTYNMFISDNFLVPYSGYEIAIPSADFNAGKVGRGIFTSIKFNCLVIVIDANVYLATVVFNQQTHTTEFSSVIPIGNLQTSKGIVYIAENNKPQIAISDGTTIYIYDPTISATIQAQTLDFTPGYITFHDTYFIAAALSDAAGNTNTWRLSGQNDGTTWPNVTNNVGAIETKPDKIQAVVRFPSKGNLIFVMGTIVTEAWFDTGNQQFPYTRTTQFNIDYGCLSAATVAYMDEYVVWLANNEKSGPIILYSDGGMPKKITTDGIDYVFAQLTAPQDSQAFIYRQDGHLFYHINFYTDNLSLFYDFNTDKFYHACDQNLNYFVASEVAFYNNQYYFVTRNNGNVFAFDTVFTTYQDIFPDGIIYTTEIPRIRTCKNIRHASQEYFVVNDIGFTIETGETDYQIQDIGPYQLITQDDQDLITQGIAILFTTQDGHFLTPQNDLETYFEAQQVDSTDFDNLVTQQDAFLYTTPRVDLSISTDGGASFGNEVGYTLSPIGKRRNRLLWWQGGLANDLVCQFKFWGVGRFVVTDGQVNVRR